MCRWLDDSRERLVGDAVARFGVRLATQVAVGVLVAHATHCRHENDSPAAIPPGRCPNESLRSAESHVEGRNADVAITPIRVESSGGSFSSGAPHRERRTRLSA